MPPPVAQKKTPGMAVASLVLGIVSLLGGAILLVPTILAIVFGHISYSKIRKDPSLGGSGLAIAGFVMGYVSILFGFVMLMMAAMAIPAFEKVREASMQKMMQNDARQIAGAAQQYMMEQGVKSVTFSIDPVTGEVKGPIATYVQHITPGTTEVDGTIDGPDDTFSLTNPKVFKGREVIFDADGRQRN